MIKMKIKKVTNLVTAALLAALICVATIFMTIGSPVANGYINIGDCFVFATIVILPLGYAMLAAGIGSALADLISGHAIYIPATFVIKVLMALAAGLIYSAMKKKFAPDFGDKLYSVSEKQKKSRSKKLFLFKIIASTAAEIIMCAGYFAYEALALGYGLSAVGNLIPNAVQGAAGIILSVILATAFEKSKVIAKFR